MRISSTTTKSVRPCTSTILYPQNIVSTPCSKPTKLNNIDIRSPSPNHLEHLKLSTSSSFLNVASTKLSKRWKDYQGYKNWEGLLDPLDDNLRREIIRYGNLVEAAYHAYDFDPSSPSYATCRYSKTKLLSEAGLAASGYRVTKNLTATSGIQLPSWAPNWMTIQSSWIGYIAVCHDRKEISRLGRRDVVIALRGTATGLEWLENLRATLTHADSDSEPMVERGFLSLYTSSVGKRPSLQKQVREQIRRILEKYGDEPLSLTITGHSLGAALATLAAYDIKKTFTNSPLVTVISFAGPRVGNWSFRCQLEKQGTKVLRIVNSDDLITKVPGFVIDNNYNVAGWVQKLVEDTQWVYADVGCELRLSSRDSPDLNGINIATCHDLKTYLHLVNGFVSSNCPVRATARKMMMNKSLMVKN